MSVEVLLADVESSDQKKLFADESTDTRPLAPYPTLLEVQPNLATLPIRFEFKPILYHPTLIKLGNHKYYYPIIIFCILEWAIFTFTILLSSFPVALFYLGLIFNLLWFISFILVELTRFDRTILKQLVGSFEWWWLVGNMIVTQISGTGLSIQRPELDSAQLIVYLIPGIIASVTSNLYIFSLDAIVLVNRKVKFLLLGFFLGSYIYSAITNCLYRGPTTTICVHFCTTLEAIYSSSVLTTTIFMTKQFIHLIRKPNSFLIITPTLEYSKVDNTNAQKLEPRPPDY